MSLIFGIMKPVNTMTRKQLLYAKAVRGKTTFAQMLKEQLALIGRKAVAS